MEVVNDFWLSVSPRTIGEKELRSSMKGTDVHSNETNWQLVSLADLDVTTGEVTQTNSGFLSLNAPATRAQLHIGLHRQAFVRFRYRGQSTETSQNASGEIVEQIGLKLRTLNTCNLLYVMWRITPPEGIVVKVKRNSGQSQHKECEANGYISILPSLETPLAITATDQRAHRLRATMEEHEAAVGVSVWVDEVLVWTGDIPHSLLFGIDGPAGFRTDNGSFIFKMFVEA